MRARPIFAQLAGQRRLKRSFAEYRKSCVLPPLRLRRPSMAAAAAAPAPRSLAAVPRVRGCGSRSGRPGFAARPLLRSGPSGKGVRRPRCRGDLGETVWFPPNPLPLFSVPVRRSAAA